LIQRRHDKGSFMGDRGQLDSAYQRHKAGSEQDGQTS
jgi:hypothetical protein